MPPRDANGSRVPLSANAYSINQTNMICLSPAVEPLPPRDERGRTSGRVAIALNAQNFLHTKTPLFVYYSGVTAIDSQPPFGPPLGGIEVRVAGTHLNVFGETKDARCRFDSWQPLVPGASLGFAEWLTAIIDVPPTLKNEDHLVCRTPRFPAGTTRVQISLNGKDFHGEEENTLLSHRFACEQHASHDVHACIVDHSCGFCQDELPADGRQFRQYGSEQVLSTDGVDYREFGYTQNRHGCMQCHGDGCAAGPSTGTCRQWTYESRILMPSEEPSHAIMLRLANVTEPTDHGEKATASGYLLPEQMVYFRVRTPTLSHRLHITAEFEQGDLKMFLKRGSPPGAERGQFDKTSSRQASPLIITIPQEENHCREQYTVNQLQQHFTDASQPPICDDWVIGLLGSGYVNKGVSDVSPQTLLTGFNLTVRTELEAADFACDGFASYAACGWDIGQSAQFLMDNANRDVVRLTNDTNQLGTLWARQPQPYSDGFVANFTFRISEASVCTKPLEMFGANRTAVNAEASLARGQRNFVPMAELRAQNEQITHYIIDHPDLPFEQLPPPRGLPPELADVVPGVPVDENALGGTHTHSRAKGYQAAAIGKELTCPDGAERVGGEGIAFVLQTMGPHAYGCRGRGVGYAGTSVEEGCGTGGIPQSIAIQFDTFHNARTERHELCVDMDAETKVCKPGALKITESLVAERQHSVGVFINGVNSPQSEALLLHYLDRYRPQRLDDEQVHEVVLSYTPPTGIEGGETAGRLDLRFDGLARPAFSMPLTLPYVANGRPHPGNVMSYNETQDTVPMFDGPQRAYVGFTAATGEASAKHDILSARFCHKAGCSAM